eukprot:CCRYP_004935-RA/>CCRYP_004935-RA protein AED:0.37 eAED:0.61 QI:32/0/0.5/1/1/1/2/0/262
MQQLDGNEMRALRCPMSVKPSIRRVEHKSEMFSQHSRYTDHEANAKAACCLANRSCTCQQFRATRMNVSFFLTLILLSSCYCCFCHGHKTGHSFSLYSRKQNMSPRTKSNDSIASSLSMRRLRPELKSLIEDASTAVKEASMSMSISFDISSSVKSVALCSLLRIWMRVTSERIKLFTLKESEFAGAMNSKYTVDLEILEHVTLDQNRRLRRLLLDDSACVVEAIEGKSQNGILQSSTSPLLVNFTMFIQFISLMIGTPASL